MDSLLKYKKCSILHILTQKPPTSVFVKMSKYAQWSCKWTITVYIYMITVHLQDYYTYLDIFTKIDVGGFWIKICKIEHFLYFKRPSMS